MCERKAELGCAKYIMGKTVSYFIVVHGCVNISMPFVFAVLPLPLGLDVWNSFCSSEVNCSSYFCVFLCHIFLSETICVHYFRDPFFLTCLHIVVLNKQSHSASKGQS